MSQALDIVYEKGPELTTQLVSIIISSLMLYNYFPESVRENFIGIPYFGSLFEFMNNVNPELLRIQNSGATVTTIISILNASNIDTTKYIVKLGEHFTRLFDKTCSLVRRTNSSLINLMLECYQNGSNEIIDAIGSIMTSDIQGILINDDINSIGLIDTNTIKSNDKTINSAAFQSVISIISTNSFYTSKENPVLEIADEPHKNNNAIILEEAKQEVKQSLDTLITNVEGTQKNQNIPNTLSLYTDETAEMSQLPDDDFYGGRRLKRINKKSLKKYKMYKVSKKIKKNNKKQNKKTKKVKRRNRTLKKHKSIHH